MECRTSRALHLGTKSGAGLRQTPCARSSARVAATSGAGAPFSAVRSHCQHRKHQTWRLLRFLRRLTRQRQTCERNACCCCVLLCVVECCCVLLCVVVEWLNYSKRMIIDKRADLSDFFSYIFFCKMCVFVSRPMKIITFLRKNRESAKRVVDVPFKRDTFRNKIMEIVEDFDEKITTITISPANRLSNQISLFFSLCFHHFSLFFFFFSILFHFFSFFHFVSFFHIFMFFSFLFFQFFLFSQFLSFSLFFLSFAFSFSFIFFPFLSFSFCWVLKI